MKTVTVESDGLKRAGNDAVSVPGLGKTLKLGRATTLTEAEYEKVEKADLENAYGQIKVEVTVEEADEPKPKEQKDSGESGGSGEPTPDPAGTVKSRSR